MLLTILLIVLLLGGAGLIGYAFRDRIVDWWASRNDDDLDDDFDAPDPANVTDNPKASRLPKIGMRRGKKAKTTKVVLGEDGMPEPVDVPWPTDNGPAVTLPDTDVDPEELIDVITAEAARLEATRDILEDTQPDSGQGAYADAVSRLRVIAHWADTHMFEADGWDGITDRVDELARHASGLVVGDTATVLPVPFPIAFGSAIPTGGTIAAGPHADRIGRAYELLGVTRPQRVVVTETTAKVERFESIESGTDLTGVETATAGRAKNTAAPEPAGVKAEELTLHTSYGLPDPLPDTVGV
ncbi:hypothetical protein DVS28_b0475 (plasmid) [Euzebya pacifica]|uniref:Uncharacterized protein n=1 Tax=Euzebya pacifica TaxID=1608957 RepID=A0A346Y6W8_9ACTN|nr:hypothetical protein [Euzebya pacifica]AXV10215.1 hypothetical protein DVS28_b0475 [Euzebya pacifica]